MIEAARSPEGILADEYLRRLEQSRKRKDREDLATILIVFEDFAHRDCLDFPREINDLVDGLRELKPDKHRFPFFYPTAGSTFTTRLTHGFVKRSQRAPREQIDKAKWVRREDLRR